MMRKLLKVVLLVSVTFAALVLVESFSWGQAKAAARHGSAKPMLTGTDGSQTGTANFQGNFTAITAQGGQVVGLARETNCSLTLLSGNYTLGTNLTYTRTGLTARYDQVLHKAAGLSTTGGTYASGCAASSVGIGSRTGVFVGTTKSGINVFAGIDYSFVTMGNALYTMTGTDATTYGITSSSFSTAGALAVGDLNGDGNNDLVVANSILTTSGSVSVLLGNANGTFGSAVSYTIAGAGAVAAVVDDVNGDGKLDIVTVSDTQMISVLTGKGDGTFNAAVSFAAPTLAGYANASATPIVNLITADVRGIGRKDIIGSNGLVLLNNGDGTFTAAAAPAFPYTIASSSMGPNLASGDLNKDGKVDLVVGTGSNVLTYMGKGDGSFTAGRSYAAINSVGYVTVSDLDGDGNPDIYVGLANGGVYEGDAFNNNLSYALMGNGDGSFQGAPTVLGAYTGNNLGDVNGDGQMDLITNGKDAFSNPLPTFQVQLGTSKGFFTLGVTITAPASFVLEGMTITGANTLSPATYAVGDINGDGKADLVFVDNAVSRFNGSQYPLPVYFTALSNGDGTFQAPVPHVFPQIAAATGYDNDVTISGLQIADLNGDGHADLIATFDELGGGAGVNPYNRGLIVLAGNGDGTFKTAGILTSTYSSATAPSTLSVPQIVTTTDLNGDNKADLLLVSPNFSTGAGATNQLMEFLGNGDGTFKAPTTITTAANAGLNCPACGIVLADLNKDGKLDLAVLGENYSTEQGQLAISLGNGDGTFGTPNIVNISGGDAVRSSSIAVADFDGDGKVDLVLMDSEDLSGIFYGKGDGTFTSVVSNGSYYPKDLINVFAGGAMVAMDLNKDGKPDLLVGNTVFLNGVAAPNAQSFTTTTALSASTTTAQAGTSITFTATVTGGSGSTGSPTGTVTFFDGTTSLGTGPVSSGVATFAMVLPTGVHNITAVYGGDSSFSGSTSSVVTVTVTSSIPVMVATSTTLTASATSVTSGTGVTFTAIVTPASGSAIPTGIVTFADGGTTLAMVTVDATGKATFSTSALAVGSHTITATYGGAPTFSGSISNSVSVTVSSIPVMVATSTALTTSATSVTSGTSVTFTAIVTPASGSAIPTGTMTFADGATTLAMVTVDATGKASFSTSALAVGSHTITATYGGAPTFSGSISNNVSVTVTAVVAADFTISISPATSTITHGNPATATVTLMPVGGFKQAVTLVCNGAPVNSACNVPASATLDGTDPATVVVDLVTSIQTGSLRTMRGFSLAGATIPLGLLGMVFGLRRRRRWGLPLMVVAITVAMFGASGCGGSGGNSMKITTTAPGTYTMTVVGTSGTLSHSATFTVTVQ